MKKINILLVFAMKIEVNHLLPLPYNTLFTGIGKVNATFSLTNYCNTKPLPDVVINYGSVGSVKNKIGGLVDCTRFLQRDMNVCELGFELGVTPLEKDIPKILDFSKTDFNPIGKNFLCASGDSLVSDGKTYGADVVDMEAYALAKVCYFLKIPFIAFKYISDNADHKASQDWQKNVACGAKLFQKKILSKIEKT